MFSPSIPWRFPFILIFILAGCGGPDEGIYSGKIGNKSQVEVRIMDDGSVFLEGYWQETLSGVYERGSLRGKEMDALVFEGPPNKRFKLRILYEKSGNELIIRSVQSRTFGPGARYLPTEKGSVFEPPPRLTKMVND